MYSNNPTMNPNLLCFPRMGNVSLTAIHDGSTDCRYRRTWNPISYPFFKCDKGSTYSHLSLTVLSIWWKLQVSLYWPPNGVGSSLLVVWIFTLKQKTANFRQDWRRDRETTAWRLDGHHPWTDSLGSCWWTTWDDNLLRQVLQQTEKN